MNFRMIAEEIAARWQDTLDSYIAPYDSQMLIKSIDKELKDVYEHGREAGKAEAAPLVRSMETAYEYLKSTNNESGCDPSVSFHEPLCAMEQDFCEALKKWREK
jgi:hypothetical protein